jgi:hypothetical protein
MARRPRGVQPTGATPLKIRLSERDRRYVDLMVRVMGVSYSEFFSMVVEATRVDTLQPVEQRVSEGAVL